MDAPLRNVQRFAQGNIFQSMGYQVNDFFVQIQGGTSKLTAFTQQFSQFAGMFGTPGAVIGGLTAVVGAYISIHDKLNQTIADTPPLLDSFVKGLGSAEERALTYAKALAGASDETKALAVEIAKLGQGDIKKAVTTPAEQLVGPLRERLQQAITAKAGTGGFGEGPEMLAATAEAQKRALAGVAEVQRQLEDAAVTGNRSAVQHIIQAMNLLSGASDDTVAIARKGLETILELVDRAKSLAATVKAQSGGGFIRGEFGPPGERQTREMVLPQSLTPRDAEQDADAALAAKNLADEAAEAAKRIADKAAADAKATAAATAHATAVENLTARIEENLAVAQRSAESTAGGAYEQKLNDIEHQKQLALIQVDKTETYAHELDLKRRDIELTAQLQRIKASKEVPLPTPATGMAQGNAARERESMDKLGEQQNAITEAHTRKLEQEAKKQYDILIEPWKDMAKEVGTITGNMFDEMLQKGKVSLGDLADTISDLFRTTISNAIGNIVSAPLQGAIAKLGDQLASAAAAKAVGYTGDVRAGDTAQPGFFSSIGSALTTKQPVTAGNVGMAGAGGGAAGYAVGSIYSQAAGLKPGNQAAVGGALGGAAGGAIGFAVSGGNPLGAMAGAAVGSAARLGTGRPVRRREKFGQRSFRPGAQRSQGRRL